MSERPLIDDVARSAGVSMATVDRVLNRRAGVRAATIARVPDAAVALGYLRPQDVQALREERPVKVVFLLPRGGNPYLNQLNQRARAIPTRGGRLRVQSLFIESFNPDALSEALLKHKGRAPTPWCPWRLTIRKCARPPPACVIKARQSSPPFQICPPTAAMPLLVLTASVREELRRNSCVGLILTAPGRWRLLPPVGHTAHIWNAKWAF